MSLSETLHWYVGNILEYTVEMLPCMSIALLLCFIFRPIRKQRLTAHGLVSSPWRDGALLLLIVFSVGLASLTLFPANLWSYLITYIRYPKFRVHGLDIASFYPSWEQVMDEIAYLPSTLKPFREIRRAFQSPWSMFMMLGNIGMFSPVGFFPSLLWKKATWWKALLVGFFSSCTIEFVQFFIGRSTDVDDIILNTLGALVGFWLFLLVRALFPRFVSKFQCHEREER